MSLCQQPNCRQKHNLSTNTRVQLFAVTQHVETMRQCHLCGMSGLQWFALVPNSTNYLEQQQHTDLGTHVQHGSLCHALQTGANVTQEHQIRGSRPDCPKMKETSNARTCRSCDRQCRAIRSLHCATSKPVGLVSRRPAGAAASYYACVNASSFTRAKEASPKPQPKRNTLSSTTAVLCFARLMSHPAALRRCLDRSHTT